MADILVTHPQLTFGGSEATVLWTIQALREDHDITLCTTEHAPVDELNDFAETNLSPADFQVDEAEIPWPLAHFDRFKALKARFFERYAQGIAEDYDLHVSGYNPLDLGQPAIQLIADLGFDSILSSRFHPSLTARGSGAGEEVLRRLYRAGIELVDNPEYDAWDRDIIVTNSRWTKGVIDERFGVDSHVIYPPVPPSQRGLPWDERDSDIVFLGRLVPKRNPRTVLRIAAEVQDRGFNTHLHLLGSFQDESYRGELQAYAEETGVQATFHGWADAATKARVLGRCKLGLSACRAETFGIAVAEMVNAGVIPLVPDEGGQVEIVGDDRLTYRSPEEAVLQIENILEDEGLRYELRENLAGRRARFSPDRFRAQISTLVQRTLKEAVTP